jgi:orotidine-5'-phosphate decarboxylase
MAHDILRGIPFAIVFLGMAGSGVMADDRSEQGYVWREATPQDHVCVTPGTRARARDDNAHAASRVSTTDRTYGRGTCAPGFVWREATPQDHVCVTPGTRAQARDDNIQAQRRRVSVRID